MRHDICLGVLAFSGVATLDRTLSSMAPLFDRVVRQIILFQEIDSPERQAWAESVVAKFPTLQPVYQTENLGQRLAFRRLADECANSTYTMVVEEDFRMTAPNTSAIDEQLGVAVSLLSSEKAQAVWMRSRRQPGEPSFEYIQFKKGALGPR